MDSPFFYCVHTESFLTYLRTERRYSPHTLEAYGRDLNDFAEYLQRIYQCADPVSITRSMVRSWVADLMAREYKATSVHRRLSAVNAWFRFLQRQGKLSSNPARGIPKPKAPKRLPTFLDDRSAREVYAPVNDADSFDEVRDRLIVILLYETGMRISELIGLRDRDIDFGAQQLRVTGKRNKTRLIPVSRPMLDELGQFARMRDGLNPVRSDETYFVTRKGKKMTRDFVYPRVKRYLSAITTLDKKSPHVLRHTFATHMLNNGAELNAIKEILGHSSLASTQVYTHLSIEKLRGIHSLAHPRSNSV